MSTTRVIALGQKKKRHIKHMFLFVKGQLDNHFVFEDGCNFKKPFIKASHGCNFNIGRRLDTAHSKEDGEWAEQRKTLSETREGRGFCNRFEWIKASVK